MSIEAERTQVFDRAFAYLAANQILGAIVELGVHSGLSLLALSQRARGRVTFAFDSFEGLPEPGEHDSDQFRGGMLRADPEQVRRLVGLAPGVEVDRLRFVEGWFADQEPVTVDVALVHLDCDLYQSAVDGLRLVDPVDGAIVLIDDYYCHRARPDKGVRRAWSEWLEATGRGSTWFDRYGWHGAAFVVHEGAP